MTSPQIIAWPRSRARDATVIDLRVRPWWRDALVATVPAWCAARVAVVAAFVLARVTVDQLGQARPPSLVDGLGGWDAHHYGSLAAHGYGSFPDSYRFFPMFPMLVRGLSPLALGHTAVVGVVLANVFAIGLGVALYRLVLHETGEPSTARVATWLVLAGAAATPLVMGYSESLGLLASIVAVLSARKGRWWHAAAWGALVGATWSLGFLIAIPLVVEARRGRRVLAGAAPIVAGALYVGWVQLSAGDAWQRVFGVQADVYDRTLRDPVSRTAQVAYDLVAGHTASGIYLPWIALAVALVVVTFRRLPACYGWFSVAIVLVALCADNIDSFERYLLRAFPLAIAGAMSIKGERATWLVTSLGIGGLVVYATAIFVGAKVP